MTPTSPFRERCPSSAHAFQELPPDGAPADFLGFERISLSRAAFLGRSLLSAKEGGWTVLSPCREPSAASAKLFLAESSSSFPAQALGAPEVGWE